MIQNMTTSTHRVALAITLSLACTLPLLPVQVKAKQQLVPIEGTSYNAESSIGSNLKAFIGKKVNVTLSSGKSLAGVVKAVGSHLLHLEKLQGKEYFDALLRIESIEAIDTRFREIKR